ncbi:14214_t:CDS:2 [Acaulospora colombiana]|uniref:14214_t:CDS:1 n=1 Tax=Acaulospora colombiana TaxID=27376 RepID=A0ACA9LGX9_9GLOM|nr:14214_t:CDS:2 [Acaulospora colombiana]
MSSSRSTRGPLGRTSAPHKERKEFDVLLRELAEIIPYAEKGIIFATESAVDLEQAEEQEEVIRLDKVVRECVDIERSLNFQKEALEKIKTKVEAGQEVDLVETFKSLYDSALEEYESATEDEKYFENNSYKDFRQKIWEVNHPDEAMPPLNGNEDDEIVMGKQKESLYCPITTLLLEEPVTSKVCKHTFSKDAILQLIRRNTNVVPCPMTGCDKQIMEHDLQPNKRIERKVAQYRAESDDPMHDVEYTSIID